MKKIVFLIFGLFTVLSHAFGSTLDSLKVCLKNAKHDTDKINLLILLLENEYDENIWPKYNESLRKLAEENIGKSKGKELAVFKKGKATAIYYDGYRNEQEGMIAKALDNYLQSLALYEEIKDTFNMIPAMITIGASYQSQGEIESSYSVFKRVKT